MVQRDEDLHYRLSKFDRQSLAWNQTNSRRQTIPIYSNSLSIADKRVRRCETCRKWFSSVGDMRQHIALTHTGTKPVVCQICGRRFGKSEQMTAHYKMHREARLQEFSILKQRGQRDVVSEPTGTSHTTVGSFHRIPKRFKSCMCEPPDMSKSYGTRQSFHISGADNSRSENVTGNDAESGKVLGSAVERYSGTRGSTRKSVGQQTDLYSIMESVSLPTITRQYRPIPAPDPGHISAIDNVMGVTRAIETSNESHFVEDVEKEFIRNRNEAVLRAGRSPTPKSVTARSGRTEYRKPKYLVDKEFWDSGSHVTERTASKSPVPGYDPYSQNILNSRSGRKQTHTVTR